MAFVVVSMPLIQSEVGCIKPRREEMGDESARPENPLQAGL